MYPTDTDVLWLRLEKLWIRIRLLQISLVILVQGSTSGAHWLVQVTVHPSMCVCTCFSNIVVLKFCILRFVSVQVTTVSYQAIFPTWKTTRGPRNVFQSAAYKWLTCEWVIFLNPLHLALNLHPTVSHRKVEYSSFYACGHIFICLL